MRIGVDFDNTIVCYDALFHRVAREQNLIPEDLPVNKSDVRNYLRSIGKEPVWTEMQGYVYGGRMAEADPYPGVLEFFKACRRLGLDVCIISHKTRHPFLGEKYDLHEAALNWLRLQGFFDESKIGLPREKVFFELTKQAKLERIGAEGCTHFIDDLPEFLAEAAFPKQAERLLFDPNDLYGEETKFVRVKNWPAILEKFVENGPASGGDLMESKLRQFVARNGFTERAQILPLTGGGNNRVFRVSEPSRSAVLKAYFFNRLDTRDRFGAERAFYNSLWTRGIRRTPEPLAWDPESRLGLFAFVDGRKLRPEEIDRKAVDQAFDFITEINSDRGARETLSLPIASEACFSIAAHLQCVERRVVRLRQIETQCAIDAEAQQFVTDELQPIWRDFRNSILRTIPAEELNRALPQEHRCISPSDFGFHNALLAADGRLRFLDFEYAGWDDAAKLICDFFCQPQLPVSLEFWDAVLGRIAVLPGIDAEMPQRARLLLPAYQIKWCCIMLNEYLRGDKARRDFAHGAESAETRKAAQLAKARQALNAVSRKS